MNFQNNFRKSMKKVSKIDAEKILKYFQIVPHNKENADNNLTQEEFDDNDALSKLKLNVSIRIFLWICQYSYVTCIFFIK